MSYTPAPAQISFRPVMYTACIWRGHELAFIEKFDRLTDAVMWARKQLTIDARAGYVDTSANITPSEREV